MRRLFVDERLLDRVRLLDRSQPVQRDDVGAGYGSDRRYTGAERLTLHDDGAGAALPEPAAEFRPPLAEVVTEDVEQRRGRVDVHHVGLTIDRESQRAHGVSLLVSTIVPTTGAGYRHFGSALRGAVRLSTPPTFLEVAGADLRQVAGRERRRAHPGATPEVAWTVPDRALRCAAG